MKVESSYKTCSYVQLLTLFLFLIKLFIGSNSLSSRAEKDLGK